jgi:hypothetical protein
LQLSKAHLDKGQLALEVQPGGGVSKVTVDDRYPEAVSRCLTRRVKGWRFPAFRGEPRRLTWSLVYVSSER